jgi:hypothetical protein
MQCQPINKFWNKAVPGNCPLTPMLSLFGAGIPHFILEVAILLCPLVEIWRLHMATTKKLAVAVMFTSGILVCGSALGTIIHTVSLDKQVKKDLTWDGLNDQIWAVCDVNLASFASRLQPETFTKCLPNRAVSIATPSSTCLSRIWWHLQWPQVDCFARNELRHSARHFNSRELKAHKGAKDQYRYGFHD